jgi:hypothetical protein
MELFREKERARGKKYRDANKGKIAESNRKYREANKDKIDAYTIANKDKISEKRKIYREANQEKIYEKIQNWKEVNRDKLRAAAYNKQMLKHEADRENIIKNIKAYVNNYPEKLERLLKRKVENENAYNDFIVPIIEEIYNN